MTSRTYAYPITVSDAMDTMKNVDDCIKEIDVLLHRLAIMDKQLIAQKEYIELGLARASSVVDYRVKLYKHSAYNYTVNGVDLAVSAGSTHSLFVNNLGNVYSFGDNSKKQLGRVTAPSDHDGARRFVSNIGHVIAISAGNYHSLGLDGYGNVYSFGDNYYGQLGHGNTTNRLEPQRIAGIIENKKIIAISAGNWHSLGLDNAGNVYSWGYNSSGQLGHGNTTNRLVPTKIENIIGYKKIIEISAGSMHNLVLDDGGNVYSWGYNYYGNLGHGDTTTRLEPKKIVKIIGGKKIRAISAGFLQNLVLDNAGKVYSFGRNIDGELGHGSDKIYNVPTHITDISNATAISSGGRHSLVLDGYGNVYSFGLGQEGQLGHVDTGNRHVPAHITAISNATAISAGAQHSLVVNKYNQVYSFGKNDRGQAGVGASATSPITMIFNDTTAPIYSLDTDRDPLRPIVKSEGGYNIPIFNSIQICSWTDSVNDPERIVLAADYTEVFNGVDIIGTKQFLIGVNSILTHPNNINQTLVTGGDVDQPYELMVAANAYRVFNTGTYPYSAGAKHALSTGVLKGLLMQGNENITGTASYNTILTAIPNTGQDVDTSSTEHFKKIRGFGLK
jgi:alpha-tubulin suppressor-like RCC1 family protein